MLGELFESGRGVLDKFRWHLTGKVIRARDEAEVSEEPSVLELRQLQNSIQQLACLGNVGLTKGINELRSAKWST